MNNEWSLQPVFGTPMISVLIGLLLLALMVRPLFKGVGLARRLSLAALRVFVVLLVLLMLLRPTLVSTTTKRQKSLLVMLFDTSRSMLLPGAQQSQTRWDAQVTALEKAWPVLQNFDEEIEVKLYGYDSRLDLVDGQGALSLPDQPAGSQTDLGGALYDALRGDAGKRFLGMIVLGDGTETALNPRHEARETARELAQLGYPLYGVAFGPGAGETHARDVAVNSLAEQYTVHVKNELVVRGEIKVSGYANQDIPVRLKVEDSAGKSEVIAQQTVSAKQDGEQISVVMTHVPEKTGRFRLTLEAEVQEGEWVEQNNYLTAFLTVLEGGIRVHYIYGSRLGEQLRLRESIPASPDIDLQHDFIDPRRQDSWPVNLGTTLSKPKFDVLILEDVSARALGPKNMQDIEKAVQNGKGLLMIGGYHSFGAGGYHGTPVANALPIQMSEYSLQDYGIDKPIRRDLHVWGKLKPVPTRDHPITRLAPGRQNEQAWRNLPALNGANIFRRLKPRAQTLLATDSRTPILVSGEYGKGRVLAMATSTTIRWWRLGYEAEHKRFWRQAMLWLVQRDELEQSDVWVRLERKRYEPGSRVVFTAGARTPQGEVVEGAQFEVIVFGPNNQKLDPKISRDGNEIVGAVDPVTTPGDYRVEVVARKQGRVLGQIRGDFIVFDRDIELSRPAPDHGNLERLAMMTREYGGRMVAPEELPSLLDELRQKPAGEELEVPVKWQLGDTFLDAWALLVAVVSLLATEWILRKNWGMV